MMVEIDNIDWIDPEIQAWYVDCLEQIRTSAIERIHKRIDAARIDNPSKIAELQQQSMVWIDLAMKTLSEDKYMLGPTKTAYEQEKKSLLTSAAVGVDKLSLEEKSDPKH